MSLQRDDNPSQVRTHSLVTKMDLNPLKHGQTESFPLLLLNNCNTCWNLKQIMQLNVHSQVCGDLCKLTNCPLTLSESIFSKLFHLCNYLLLDIRLHDPVSRKSPTQVQITWFVNVRTISTAKYDKTSLRCVYVKVIQGKYLDKSQWDLCRMWVRAFVWDQQDTIQNLKHGGVFCFHFTFKNTVKSVIPHMETMRFIFNYGLFCH